MRVVAEEVFAVPGEGMAAVEADGEVGGVEGPEGVVVEEVGAEGGWGFVCFAEVFDVDEVEEDGDAEVGDEEEGVADHGEEDGGVSGEGDDEEFEEWLEGGEAGGGC